MNKSNSIRVEPSSYERLFALPCVTCVCHEGDAITVALDPAHVSGSARSAFTGDYLVEVSPGSWRRFSSRGYARFVKSRKRQPIADASPNASDL